MVAKRLAALVAAVALVAAAFAFRASRNDAKAASSPTTAGTGATTATTQPGQPLRVVCATELAALCAGLGSDVQVAVADAGATLDTISKEGVAPDVWVTLDPWPQLANQSSPVFADGPAVIGASGLGIAVRNGRDVPLKAVCGDPLRTQCLGDKSGAAWTSIGGQATWQTVKPVFDKPSRSAVGLLAFVAAVVNRPAPTSLARIDLESDDPFMAWTRGIGTNAQTMDPVSGSALEQAANLRRYDIVVTTQQQYTAIAASSFTFIPFPTGQAHVVAAARTGVNVPKDLTTKLTDLARQAGWNADVAPTALPSPAEVAGLQQIWNQATA